MMNGTRALQRWAFCCLATSLWAGSLAASTGLVRTQTLQLREGWNSIYLEVTPEENTPDQVFAGLPVEKVATFYPRESPVEYISDPGTAGWNKENWAIWYAPHRADAFLSSLHAVHAHQAYLILASEEVTWTVEGLVERQQIRWKSDSFNHVGFVVDAVAPPTFAQCFAGSKAHQNPRIYRLVNGHWALVESPANTLMQSGEACWVFCQGSSDFQGPLDIRLQHQRGLIFGGDDRAPFAIRNRSPMPVTIAVHTQADLPSLPLSYRIRVLGEKQIRNAAVPLPATLGLGNVEPDEVKGFYFEVRPEEMTAPVQRTLLRISTDLGIHYWIPVVAHRSAQPVIP